MIEFTNEELVVIGLIGFEVILLMLFAGRLD